jgi:hypothetical protein
MFVAGLTIFMTCITSPIFLVSSMAMKVGCFLGGLKQLDTSKESVSKDVDKFVQESNRMFCSIWLLNNTVHVLCRYATIFANRPPIIILANSCSFDYIEFMKNVPKIYDVYCIDLPTYGLNPIYGKEASDLFCENHLDAIVSELYPSTSTSTSTKFTILCESYGATLITKAIMSGAFKTSKVNELILINLSRLSTHCLSTIHFKMCFSHFILRNSWAPFLFSAFLYPRKDSLNRIRAAFKFISNNCPLDMRSTWVSTFDLKNILYLSGKVKISLVEDTVTGCDYAKLLRERSGNAIKFHCCTLNPLDNRASKRCVYEFTNTMDY